MVLAPRQSLSYPIYSTSAPVRLGARSPPTPLLQTFLLFLRRHGSLGGTTTPPPPRAHPVPLQASTTCCPGDLRDAAAGCCSRLTQRPPPLQFEPVRRPPQSRPGGEHDHLEGRDEASLCERGTPLGGESRMALYVRHGELVSRRLEGMFGLPRALRSNTLYSGAGAGTSKQAVMLGLPCSRASSSGVRPLASLASGSTPRCASSRVRVRLAPMSTA